MLFENNVDVFSDIDKCLSEKDHQQQKQHMLYGLESKLYVFQHNTYIKKHRLRDTLSSA